GGDAADDCGPPAVRARGAREMVLRRILVSLALASALSLVPVLPATAASAQSKAPPAGSTLLALGDSVAFGTDPLRDPHDASNFVGYPEIVAQRLNLVDVNGSCPGEATGGFLSLIGIDNGCRPYRLLFPLHVRYFGTQMNFAISYLNSHPNVGLVTIDLGANDVFF